MIRWQRCDNRECLRVGRRPLIHHHRAAASVDRDDVPRRIACGSNRDGLTRVDRVAAAAVDDERFPQPRLLAFRVHDAAAAVTGPEKMAAVARAKRHAIVIERRSTVG